MASSDASQLAQDAASASGASRRGDDPPHAVAGDMSEAGVTTDGASQPVTDHDDAPRPHASQEEVFTIELNSWLMDRRLDDARAGLTRAMFDLSRVSDLQKHVESMWRGLQSIETAQAAMATAMGLVESRRQFGEAGLEADAHYVKLSEVLRLRLLHLQKIGNIVLEEYLQPRQCSYRNDEPDQTELRAETPPSPHTAPGNDDAGSDYSTGTAAQPPAGSDEATEGALQLPASSAEATGDASQLPAGADDGPPTPAQLRPEDVIGIQNAEAARGPPRSLHNLARDALNRISARPTREPVVLDGVFPWVQYVAAHRQGAQIIGPGITQAIAMWKPGTNDSNRGGAPRLDFHFFREDGSVCRVHPGNRPKNDANLIFEPAP